LNFEVYIKEYSVSCLVITSIIPGIFINGYVCMQWTLRSLPPRLTRRSLIQSCECTSHSYAAFFIHLQLHLTSYSSLDSRCYDLMYDQTSIHADCWYPPILPSLFAVHIPMCSKKSKIILMTLLCNAVKPIPSQTPMLL
jgi:hypothetical protein